MGGCVYYGLSVNSGHAKLLATLRPYSSTNANNCNLVASDLSSVKILSCKTAVDVWLLYSIIIRDREVVGVVYFIMTE